MKVFSETSKDFSISFTLSGMIIEVTRQAVKQKLRMKNNAQRRLEEEVYIYS